MRVELRDEAREDLVDGAWFYGRQRAGLGEYFVDCVAADLATLESTFGVYEMAFGFHRKLVDRFPFAIYYLVGGFYVDVVAVLDCRQDPFEIEQRLGRTKGCS